MSNLNIDDVMPDVRAFLVLWAQAFNAHDVEKLAALYALDASLYGTSSSKLYSGAEEIRTYFRGTHTVEFEVWRSARLAANLVLVVGNYVFSQSFTDQIVATPARFTFVLSHKDGAWQILHHHSSRSP
ncbi:SgcJ/EcaC family oxidoreductase [Bradyrhizobium sp. LCT2]|uniref:SgcJ/EcaC family oxidoreductase n=1 Tax=Bradyrhizobium sp. LCT2 TaxID=2493093 RepID=UPI001FED51B3|nr:SgcJ/EcaC family oxidoreductase [Bradyrhizobium sp. LCT2]